MNRNPLTPATAQAQHRITRLATQLSTHRAFHWLHLHQPQLRLWQLELLAIPAPTFHESARAAWFLERFRALGLTNVHLDEAGNALAELSSDPAPEAPLLSSLREAPLLSFRSPSPLSFRSEAEESPVLSFHSEAEESAVARFSTHEEQSASPAPLPPVILLSAHLDTVFPPNTPTTPTENGPRILGPGATDNGAGLTALLALAAALRFAKITPATTILFAANVGEEGEGDLSGMRHLFESGSYKGRIQAALALEGSGTAAAVDRALGSRRFRVTVIGPGGHSWTDAASPNPIVLLARGIAALSAINLAPSDDPNAPRTTLTFGQISGGTSVNSIPESAQVLIDIRSTDPSELQSLELELHRTFENLIAQQTSARVPVLAPGPTSKSETAPIPTLSLKLDRIGNRPAASLPANSPIRHTLRSVDRHLGLRTELRLGSTDANIPLALDIPALALAAGGTGGGIHTLAEWYDPTGRETALRRILLTLLDLLDLTAT